MAGSRKTSVLVSTRTSKPSRFSQPRIMEAQRSGSCPAHPPQTIIAVRMVMSSIELAGGQARRQHGRALHGGFELHAASLVGRGLERLHGFQRMEGERAAG